MSSNDLPANVRVRREPDGLIRLELYGDAEYLDVNEARKLIAALQAALMETETEACRD